MAALASLPKLSPNISNRMVFQEPLYPIPLMPIQIKPPNFDPTLLKTLEAAVAAKTCGVIGPVPMGAAACIPGLSPNSSNGVNPQAANKKQTAMSTVMQPAEVVGSLQPARKEVWICGNSVILASKKRAENNSAGLQLGIPASKAYVYWHGIQAMKWRQLLPLLHEMYQLRSPPSVILIHLGEDDLLPEDNTLLIMSMKNDLSILRRAFLDAVIVWSSLLPRCCSKKDQNHELMGKAKKQVNRIIIDYCSKIGVNFLSHNLITSYKTGLFLPNGQLSNVGADLFITDLQNILKFGIRFRDRC